MIEQHNRPFCSHWIDDKTVRKLHQYQQKSMSRSATLLKKVQQGANHLETFLLRSSRRRSGKSEMVLCGMKRLWTIQRKFHGVIDHA